MRAAKADYLSFVHELDKIISENINRDFFSGKIDPDNIVSHSDGTIERKQKGTLTLLDEWLFSGGIDWHGKVEEARGEIVRPLRRIRHERQPSAHSIIKNEFDIKYVKLKREVLEDATFALGNILRVLLTHPRSPKVRLPKWFEEGRIEAI